MFLIPLWILSTFHFFNSFLLILWCFLHFNRHSDVEDTEFNRIGEWMFRQPLHDPVPIIKPLNGNQHAPHFTRATFDHQCGTCVVQHHSIGDATEKCLCKTTPSSGPNHDEIGRDTVGIIQNQLSRTAGFI